MWARWQMASSSLVSHQGRAGDAMCYGFWCDDGGWKAIFGEKVLEIVSTGLFKICYLKIEGMLRNVEGRKITKSKNILRVLDSGEPNSVITSYRKTTINFYWFHYFAFKGCAGNAFQEFQRDASLFQEILPSKFQIWQDEWGWHEVRKMPG